MTLGFSRQQIIPLLAFFTLCSKGPLFSGKLLFSKNSSFLFLNLFLGNEIITFVIILIFAAMDFWTVKNITGRILVNLRWWSDIDEVGNEKWVFESNEEKREVGATDSFVFWGALYITPVAWAVFALMDFISIKFFWMLLCILCLVLSSTNTMAFY